jgi:hypothetical protein
LVVLVPVDVPVPADPVPPVAAPVPPVGALGAVPPVAAPVLPLVVPEDAAPELPDDVVLGGVVVDEGVELEASSPAVVEVLSADAAAPPIDVLAGATSAWGFFGTTSCVASLPPQADSPPVARSIRATAVARRRMI